MYCTTSRAYQTPSLLSSDRTLPGTARRNTVAAPRRTTQRRTRGPRGSARNTPSPGPAGSQRFELARISHLAEQLADDRDAQIDPRDASRSAISCRLADGSCSRGPRPRTSREERLHERGVEEVFSPRCVSNSCQGFFERRADSKALWVPLLHPELRFAGVGRKGTRRLPPASRSSPCSAIPA